MVYYCLQDGGQVGRNSWQRECHLWYRPPARTGVGVGGSLCTPLSSSAELHSVCGMGSHSDLSLHLPEPPRYNLYTIKRSLPKVRRVQNKSRSAETWVLQSMPLGSQAARTQEVWPFGGIVSVCYFGSTSFPLMSFFCYNRIPSRIDTTLHLAFNVFSVSPNCGSLFWPFMCRDQPAM